jgi:type II secretory pathway pseudopilin PulG
LRKRAFTFTEILIVVGIALLLAALLMPVYRRVLMNAKISGSLQKLRRLQVAISLYRSEEGSPVVVDSLPTGGHVFSTYLGLSKDAFVSPCDHQSEQPTYTYQFSRVEQRMYYFSLRGEESVIFTDHSCNEDPRAWDSYFGEKRGLGVQLDGRLLNLRKRGFPGDFWWWVP